MLPPKKDVALALLERSQVFIHLDPRQKGVVVPTQFRKQAQLVLQIGLEMPIPIPDLEIDDAGIGCTLSFNRAPFHCSLPWSAIFALVGDDGRGMVWPDDVPPEVSSQAQSRSSTTGAPASKRPRKAPEAAPAPAARTKRGKATGSASSESSSSSTEGRDVRTKLAIVPDAITSEPVAAAKPSATAVTEPEKADDPPVPPEAPRKPKRELPPYLRVVK